MWDFLISKKFFCQLPFGKNCNLEKCLLKSENPGFALVTGDSGVIRQTSMVHSVNDIPVVSMVKDTDEPTKQLLNAF